MGRAFLNPVTRRRVQRFGRLRRARWSLVLLVGLYGLGLLAPVVCNNVPLAVGYEGRVYFPLVQFVPDDVFTGSGRQTRPDYKALAERPGFGEGGGNWMLFPPVPFGPNESVPPEAIDLPEDVTVSFLPLPRVGRMRLGEEGTILRARGAAELVGAESDTALRGRALGEVLEAPPGIGEALRGRFANEEMPGYEAVAAAAGGGEVAVQLSPFEPRPRAPRTVSATLRDRTVAGRDAAAVVFGPEGDLRGDPPALWQGLDAEQKEAVRSLVRERAEADTAVEARLSVAGSAYRVRAEREAVAYPFRPTPRHPFGLDSSGRDVLTRVIYAFGTSLNFGLMLVFATMAVGILAGALQGYYGGRVDIVTQRLTEIWESMPFLYVLILMGSVFGQNFWVLLLAYALFNWVGISYYMRGEFLKLRHQPFVEAAKVMGLSSPKIIFRHILPNGLVPVITFFPFSLVGAIGVLAALDFLGFGLPPPTPSWGELLAQGQEFRRAWWLILYPSLALFLVMLLCVFVGEGIREAFDPKSESRYV